MKNLFLVLIAISGISFASAQYRPNGAEVAKQTASGWLYLDEATGEYLPWSEYRKLKTGKSAAVLEKTAAEDITLKASNFVIRDGSPQWIGRFECDSTVAGGILFGRPDVEIIGRSGERFVCTMDRQSGEADAGTLRIDFEVGICSSYYSVTVLDACVNGKELHDLVCRADGELKTSFVTKDAFRLNGLFSNIFDVPAEYRPVVENTVEYAEVKAYYCDGERWQMASQNGIGMAVMQSVVRDYGKWYKVWLLVRNDSESEFDFDPAADIRATVDDGGQLQVWSSEEYLRKVKRSQSWETAALAFSSGLAAGMAGYTTYSGTVSGAYGSSYVSGTAYNAGAAVSAGIQSQRMIAEQEMLNEMNIKTRKYEYLKRNTVFCGQSVAGYILIKYRAGSRLCVTADISGAHFRFIWDME